jgi:hypothetical protein
VLKQALAPLDLAEFRSTDAVRQAEIVPASGHL